MNKFNKNINNLFKLVNITTFVGTRLHSLYYALLFSSIM